MESTRCSGATAGHRAARQYATVRAVQRLAWPPCTTVTCCFSPRHHRRLRLAPAPAATAPRQDEDSRVPVISIDPGLPLMELEQRRQLCDSGLPDVEECLIPEEPLRGDVLTEAISRGRWLLGLLIVQSTSSFVLSQYEELLRDHIVVTLFLTMLVGAGGNAGNQSAIKVIRALATGSVDASADSFRSMMADQAQVAMLLGGGLSVGGFVRVYATSGNLTNACAISASLFMIVMTSVVLGTGLPFLLAKAGIDPANAGTSIQVVMDILGVGITCFTCQLVLVQFAHGFV